MSEKYNPRDVRGIAPKGYFDQAKAMTAPRYTVDDFNTQAAYESHHERTYAMLRQAAETERALTEHRASLADHVDRWAKVKHKDDLSRACEHDAKVALSDFDRRFERTP